MRKILVLVGIGCLSTALLAQTTQPTPSGYLLPPKAIVDVLDAPPPPTVELSASGEAMAVLERGDVAVVQDPGYAVYAGGTILADAEVHGYPLRAEQDFLLELEEVPADVLARTRLVYLNYPNNPTAAARPASISSAPWSGGRHGILLVYDNPYCEITFEPGTRSWRDFKIDLKTWAQAVRRGSCWRSSWPNMVERTKRGHCLPSRLLRDVTLDIRTMCEDSRIDSAWEAWTANRVAGRIALPAPTPPDMRVRIRRFRSD